MFDEKSQIASDRSDRDNISASKNIAKEKKNEKGKRKAREYKVKK